MCTPQNLLTQQLGELPKQVHDFVLDSFTALVQNLQCGKVHTHLLQAPEECSPRDKILCLIDQMRPGVLDSDAGPQVETVVNAIIARVAAELRDDKQIGTVNP